jgi:hypothetical protein
MQQHGQCCRWAFTPEALAWTFPLISMKSVPWPLAHTASVTVKLRHHDELESPSLARQCPGAQAVTSRTLTQAAAGLWIPAVSELSAHHCDDSEAMQGYHAATPT